MNKMLKQTLVERLTAKGLTRAVPVVVKWLDDLAAQAHRDGASVAPDVFEKTAQKLRDGVI